MPLGDNWVPYTPQGPAATGPDPSTTQGPSRPFAGPNPGRPNIPYAPGPQPGTEFMKPKQKPADPSQPISGPSSRWAPPGSAQRYVVKNGNSLQFNKPAIRNAVEKGLDAFATARFYRHAGFTAGLRGSLGMKPTPSHMNDWIRARHNVNMIGQNPGASEEQEYEHW